MRASLFGVFGALSIGLSACGGTDSRVTTASTGGTVIIVQPVEPSGLFPPTAGGTEDRSVIDAVFDRLAEIGDSMATYGDVGFKPRLARRWTWSPDSLSIAFHLDSAARWHDGTPVRAADVRFTFDVYADDAVGSDMRSNLGNIDSVTVRDSLTAVYWFKRRLPQQFFDATYHTYILPSHLLDTVPREKLVTSAFTRNPVGTGRFRFVKWTEGERLEIVADTGNSRGRALLDRVIWSFTSDNGKAAVKLFQGEADVFENIRAEDLPQAQRSPTLRVVDNHSLTYNFIGFNARAKDNPNATHPVFNDRAVRRALQMAVDREKLVRNVFDTLAQVVLGPAPRALIPDTTSFRQIPYDVEGARALLDSAGWKDSDNDGVREKNGVPLAFELMTPAPSESRKRYAVLLQEQLRAIGVQATPVLLDPAAYYARVLQGKFDTYSGGWQTDPGLQGLRQTWRSTGTSNYGKYASTAFDANLDSAIGSFDSAARRRFWAGTFQQIIDDAPALWMYEQRIPLVVHSRLVVPRIRADGWYNGLADWSVNQSQRIDRDRIGLGAGN